MYVFYFLTLKQGSSSPGAKCSRLKDTQGLTPTCIQAVNSGQESPHKTVLAFHLGKSAESSNSSNRYRTAPVRTWTGNKADPQYLGSDRDRRGGKMPLDALDEKTLTSLPRLSDVYDAYGVRVNALSVNEIFALYERAGFLY